ncbi:MULTISPECIES: PTS transporter subunit EIIC [unclassified Breznakia]|uniref:PTS sugar transporter subunit IIC n=1 Tax=unclassified Breznakia TaxID=2623764 RepID=UPI002473E927|nr:MULTISPECIES: PTS transporter subunit EIIC [unclassified Breznakia]MDH6366636.1 PTS system cellobiose-specific IIC component [Breznakia sp. PH1-1]MDH6403729.1 PTS system cellobiose-specific IIC component [Breznakia sp. PF1-11]MDH6411438.1 PTS system cellobiose-specific IIC component [Breznakia sp. PFB1-11]MDH6413831.1 PTS system cellobiose-specific IIC component [Breznakia sp. PFB1-14]MDH6416261.1 PTS system cellobiose-specific IIC component [Breznakia sp. PFB1-4]
MNQNSFSQKLNKLVTKFSNNLVVKTISSGMARLLPVIMIGSVVTLLISLPIDPWLEFLASSGLGAIITIGSTMTNDIITIYLVVALAYDMARLLKVSQINAVMVAVVSFFIITPMTAAMIGENTVNVFTTTYLGSRGMFVGIFVALISTYLFYLLTEKGPKIKMPSSVPPAISGSFESLIPAIGVAALFIVISALFSLTSWGDVHSAVYAVLQSPLEGLGSSIWTMVFLALLGEFFWFFGIHGSNVTRAANSTLFTPPAIENASNIAAGLPATNVVNAYFLDVFKGPRHTVLSAMLFFMAKSKQLKAVGKVAVVPGLFGISEPMKFGIPMVFNPIILIPMSLAPVISLLIAYFATAMGLVPVVCIAVPWAVPPIIGGFLAAGWQGAILQIVQMIAIFILYLPFFKLLDKRKCEEEAAIEAQATAEAA